MKEIKEKNESQIVRLSIHGKGGYFTRNMRSSLKLNRIVYEEFGAGSVGHYATKIYGYTTAVFIVSCLCCIMKPQMFDVTISKIPLRNIDIFRPLWLYWFCWFFHKVWSDQFLDSRLCWAWYWALGVNYWAQWAPSMHKDVLIRWLEYGFLTLNSVLKVSNLDNF